MQDEGNACSGQVGKHRVFTQAGEKLFHNAAVRQDADCIRHVHQAGKQDAEADDNMSYFDGISGFHPHDNDNADDQGQGR